MNKLKQLKIKYLALAMVLALVLIGEAGWYAYAHTYINNSNIENYNAASEITGPAEEPSLGSVASPIFGPWTDQNGRRTYVVSGSLTDASTTILSFVNPFGTASTSDPTDATAVWNAAHWGGTNATSTVESLSIEITGPATTSMQFDCGVAANHYDGYTGAATVTYSMFHLEYATGSVGVVESGQATTSGLGIAVGTIGKAIGSLPSKVYFTRNYSYFVCKARAVDEAADTGWASIKGLTGDTNTFTGNFKAVISQNYY